MAKAEWGTKRVCLGCGARYYDMKKNPPVCPSCGATFDPEAQNRTRRGRGAEKKAAPEQAPEREVDDLPAANDDEADDTLIEDAEELSDNDMDEVVDLEEEEA